jgi:hypothetical protein
MPHTSLPEKQIQGNPLEFHLRAFASSLVESGYQNRTIQEKLYFLADFGRWFGRSMRAVSHVDERLVEAFVKHKQRVRWGSSKTVQQFLDHLRKRDIIPHRKSLPRQRENRA